MSAKNAAEIRTAHTGRTLLCSSPLRIMPLHSHSSNSGAKMLTLMKLAQMIPVVMPFSISSSCSGISGSSAVEMSRQKPDARVAATTSRPQIRPPVLP